MTLLNVFEFLATVVLPFDISLAGALFIGLRLLNISVLAFVAYSYSVQSRLGKFAVALMICWTLSILTEVYSIMGYQAYYRLVMQLSIWLLVGPFIGTILLCVLAVRANVLGCLALAISQALIFILVMLVRTPLCVEPEGLGEFVDCTIGCWTPSDQLGKGFRSAIYDCQYWESHKSK